MNHDTVFQLIRYNLIWIGGVLVGRGLINAGNWDMLIPVLAEMLTGLVLVVGPQLWGVWVKWKTQPVADKVIIKNAIPTINSATGATVQPSPKR